MMQHIVFLVVLLEVLKSKGAVRFMEVVIRVRDQLLRSVYTNAADFLTPYIHETSNSNKAFSYDHILTGSF